MRTIQQKRQLPGNLALDRDDAGGFPARQGCRRPRSSGVPYPKWHGGIVRRTRTLDLAPPKQWKRNSPSFREAPRHRKAKIARGWQDLRTMHGLRGLCSEKRPSLARSARYAFPKGDLWGFSDAWRAYLAKASSFWIHGGDMLPGRGAFPVRGPFGDA